MKKKMAKSKKRRIPLWSLAEENGIKSKKYRIRKKYIFLPWYKEIPNE